MDGLDPRQFNHNKISLVQWAGGFVGKIFAEFPETRNNSREHNQLFVLMKMLRQKSRSLSRHNNYRNSLVPDSTLTITISLKSCSLMMQFIRKPQTYKLDITLALLSRQIRKR